MASGCTCINKFSAILVLPTRSVLSKNRAVINTTVSMGKLSKVQKHVSKKKGAKIHSLHENSRDALRLRKAGARDDKVAKGHKLRKGANRQWVERVEFFQENLPDTLHPLEQTEIHRLIEHFLQRHEEEMSQLKAERRPGRPASTRQTLLELQMQQDRAEYESGFWLPNLEDVDTLQKLDSWDGRWLSLGQMKFVRAHKTGTIKESKFPPSGAS
nr:translation machinery-associated protein 16 [Quercus suber]